MTVITTRRELNIGTECSVLDGTALMIASRRRIRGRNWTFRLWGGGGVGARDERLR